MSIPCAIRYTVFSVVRTEYRHAYSGERRSPHRMPGDTPERDEDGQFTARVPEEEILDAVRDLEPVGTVDVGEAVGRLFGEGSVVHYTRLFAPGYKDVSASAGPRPRVRVPLPRIHPRRLSH